MMTRTRVTVEADQSGGTVKIGSCRFKNTKFEINCHQKIGRGLHCCSVGPLYLPTYMNVGTYPPR